MEKNDKETTLAKRWIQKKLKESPDLKAGIIYRDAVLDHPKSMKVSYEEFVEIYSEIKYP